MSSTPADNDFREAFLFHLAQGKGSVCYGRAHYAHADVLLAFETAAQAVKPVSTSGDQVEANAGTYETLTASKRVKVEGATAGETAQPAADKATQQDADNLRELAAKYERQSMFVSDDNGGADLAIKARQLRQQAKEIEERLPLTIDALTPGEQFTIGGKLFVRIEPKHGFAEGPATAISLSSDVGQMYSFPLSKPIVRSVNQAAAVEGLVTAALAWAEAWRAVWEDSDDHAALDDLNNASKSLYDATCDYQTRKGEA